MTTLVMNTTAVTAFEPVQLKSAEEYRCELMIAYAFQAFGYVITAKEVDEVINEGLWEDVDDFVEYMMEANFGAPVADTTNVKLPSTMRIYTSEELDLMDAGLFVDEARSGDDEETLVGSEEDEEEEAGDVENNEEVETDLESNPSTLLAEAEDVYEEDKEEPLPLYSPDTRPTYPDQPADDPPAYTLQEVLVEEAAVEEVAVAPIPDATPVPVPAFAVETETTVPIVAVHTESVAKVVGRKRAVFTRAGRKILVVKRTVARRLKVLSPKRLFRKA